MGALITKIILFRINCFTSFVFCEQCSEQTLFFFFPLAWPGAVKKNSQGIVDDKERSEKILLYPIDFHRHKLYATLLAMTEANI